jgi:enediyne biosynthesis protein E4
MERYGNWIVLVYWLIVHGQHDAYAGEWQTNSGYRWMPLSVPVSGSVGFETLNPNQTGIAFTNVLPEDRYLTNQILLNGSGVALGDVDEDGWCDVFLCGIDRPSALYHNLGNWRFADIATQAGVACAGQPSSGAALADINSDGHLDLLVNGVGTGTRLFLNDGSAHFTEVTAQSGLRGGAGSMSMALADIDGNGTLDLYVANYRTTTLRDELEARFKASVVKGQYEILSVNGRPVTEPDLVGRYAVDPTTGILENGEADVLYRNDGQGKFTPVIWTDGSFVNEDGKPIGVPYDWGLSVMFRDLNGDGAPDIYVCNDFHSEDRVWINNGSGKFRAIARLALRQTSLFSMGIDFADIDRDGSDDFFIADMLSRKHTSRQIQLMDRRPISLPLGLIDNRPQYSRNTLFWNRGDLTFAEIAQFSGVEASEWSWCPVFLDVDLDGFEDLLLVTGHVRDAQNIDISRRIEAMTRGKNLPLLDQLRLRRMFTKLEVPNFAFRNQGDLTFKETGSAWGFDSHRVSQGIALADLDNDGGLDIVVNCLNEGALVLRNKASRPRIAIRLHGMPPNTQGIGSRITVRQAGFAAQSQEVICGGRYLSSDEPLRVFAAASAESALAIEVKWRSGRRLFITDAKPNRLYEFDEDQAQVTPPEPSAPEQLWFADLSDRIGHKHAELDYDDYQRQPLLPFKLSQLGPGISWHDLDGDGWEDLIIPSGRGGQLAVFRNDGKGGFNPWNSTLLGGPVNQDQTSAIGWKTENGQAQLVVGSANYEDNQANGPVAYWFELSRTNGPDSMPAQPSSTGPIALGDADGDGQLELFVGGRVLRGRFPEPATSLLFRRQAGVFKLDEGLSQALVGVGLVSAAVWTDLDGDGAAELVLTCQPGLIRAFKWVQGRLVELTENLGLSKYHGLWNSVTAGDFDGDGRMDLAAGNWGRNTQYQSGLAQPIHFFYGDLDGDGILEVIEAYYDTDLKKIVPRRDWETLSTGMPFLKSSYRSFTEFSTAGVQDFWGDNWPRINDAVVDTLESMAFLNRGDHFEAHALPRETQFAPVFGLVAGDLDGDGHEDLFACQNFFEVPPLSSRLDAGRGVWLKGNGQGGFVVMPGSLSGLRIYGEGRGAALCDYDHDGRIDLALAQNANRTKLYQNQRAKPGLRIQLEGPPGNSEGIGAIIRLQYQGGRRGPAREVHAGSGYWSQDAATQVMGPADNLEAILIKWPGGKTQQSHVPKDATEMRIAIDARATKLSNPQP